MSICILGNDDLGNRSLVCQYLLHYLEEKQLKCGVVIFEKIGIFLAEYISVKNNYFNLKIEEMSYQRKTNRYKISPRDAVLNNLNEEEIAQYERDANFVYQNVEFYPISKKNFRQVMNLIENNQSLECVFIHGYIKYLADIGQIVMQGLEEIKAIEMSIEPEGRKLFFSSFIPSLDYIKRERIKKYCTKTFANVLLCIDKRLVTFTKEDYQQEEYMSVTNKNENLIAYRIKLDPKVKIEWGNQIWKK